MIVAGHQPNYLPYLGFFHKMAQVDTFIILDNVQFVKGGPFGWMNRNKIRTREGWIWLTVPVLTKGKFAQRIMDVNINSTISWKRKHWRSIWLSYNKAPYFNKYADLFYETYDREWEKLVDLNEALILQIKEAMGIKTRILRASTLGVEGKATELIINICEKLGADQHLYGVHGRDYVDVNLMREKGIESLFQEFHHPQYHQLYEPFIPHMSIIDLLFNEGERGLEILMEGKNLKPGNVAGHTALRAEVKDDRAVGSMH